MELELIKLFVILFAIYRILERTIWIYRIKSLYSKYVFVYAQDKEKDADFILDAMEFFSSFYFYLYFWEYNPRFFIKYPAIYDEVISFMNNKQRILAEKIAQIIKEENLNNRDEK